MPVKTRVRSTSETVVGDVEIHHQRYRVRRSQVRPSVQFPTMSTPDFSYVLCLDCMCCVEKGSVVQPTSHESFLYPNERYKYRDGLPSHTVETPSNHKPIETFPR